MRGDKMRGGSEVLGAWGKRGSTPQPHHLPNTLYITPILSSFSSLIPSLSPATPPAGAVIFAVQQRGRWAAMALRSASVR